MSAGQLRKQQTDNQNSRFIDIFVEEVLKSRSHNLIVDFEYDAQEFVDTLQMQNIHEILKQNSVSLQMLF